MSDQFDVINVGKDSIGRPVKMTRRAKLMLDIACEEAKVDPVITQGCFLGEDAATASAGTHDRAGCIDTGTISISDEEVSRLVRAGRRIGAVSWPRPTVPGEWTEHQHWLFLGDSPMHPDAIAQVAQYKAGTNGLANHGPDPFFRPNPLVTTFNYDAYLAEEGEMNLNDKLFPDREDSPTVRESLVNGNQANRKLDKVLERLADARKVNAQRDATLAAQLDRVADAAKDDATKEQVKQVVAELRQQHREDSERDT